MPQMAPMLWLILFLYFVLLFIMFISNFYFSFCPSLPAKTSGSVGGVDSSMSWQW